MLRGNVDCMEAVEGRLTSPGTLPQGAGDADVAAYNQALSRFKQADCCALLILTTNMTEETLQKVMRFETAYEVWRELHKLFDGESEDRAYNICMEFFSFKRNMSDDVSTHMSKLKNIWTNLNIEIMKSDVNCKLPDLFLICKILETLDDRFFAFKSSWLLLNKTDRTVDNLTAQLCSYEKALENKAGSQETLVIQEVQKSKKIKCNYCSQLGHRVRNCKKWIKDGRPPKSTSSISAPNSSSNQVQQISLMVNACSREQIQDRNNWFVDNGATTHIAIRSDFFFEFHEFQSDHSVRTADGAVIPALGKGTIVVNANVNDKQELITLRDVWLVPSLTKNLFSTLAAQDRMQNSIFMSTTRDCKLDIEGSTKIVGKRLPYGGLYKLDMTTVMPAKQRSIEVNAITGSNLLQLYHERFAHQDKRHVRDIVKRELGINLKPDNAKCEGCIYGKSQRKKFGTRERAAEPGEIIHTDVCGPFADSISKYKYFVLFKDDFSNYRFVYFIRHKSEVKDKLLHMLQEVKTTGHTVKTLLSDNGGEFDNEAVKKILQKFGIQHRLTMPYTPEQNGCSERENRTLVEAARSMLHARGEMPQVLWAELINTAAYVLNRTGPTRVDAKVPFELWHNRKPKISHLKIIGSECYAHIPKQCRKKMDKKAIKGMLIGYENDDGYRIWDGKKTLRSRDITFQSDVEFKISTSIPIRSEGNNDDMHGLIQEQTFENIRGSQELDLEGDITEDQVQEDIVTPTEQVQDNTPILTEDEDNFADCQEQLEVVEPLTETRYNLRNRATINRPKKLEDFVCFVGLESFPETYDEAIKREDSNEWQTAMAREMKSLADNNVWTLCDLPSNKKALPCKWVFRVKRNPDGTVEKYKARLVVKGFKQRKGIDFEQTFSPVARMASIRALLSVSAKEKLHLTQFDVSTAFLNSKLKEEIYMKQPDGFSDGTSKVCRLQRCLYGLKQAPRYWNSCFEEILLKKGFTQNVADSCLFMRKIGDKKIIIALYVDDGLVATTDKALANQFLKELGDTLKITVKPASYYLGLEIAKLTDGSITITQQSYTKKILERFGMSECNPISTPIEKTSETGKVEEKEPEEKFPYREAVGALAYLMTGTRPDIAYAVGVVSRKLENPTQADWLKVKRIFRYLKGTASYGIKYTGDSTKAIIEGYSDADHAGDEQTGRSTTGVACLFASGVVSWLSQRQASVAISTTEAEIVAASEGARELVWLQRLYSQLTILEDVPTLKVDNEAAIRLAHNPEFHKRTKHIRVRHFFVRETVQEGLVDVQKTSSTDQLADLMTKAVPKPTLNKLRAKLGLHNISN